MTAGRDINAGSLFFRFLWLGVTSFGGPAAHIARMDEDLVERRRWVDRQQFLDLLAVTNLIPGPNSTEMAIHLGFLLRGWRGLVLAGTGFILPAATLSVFLAWAYQSFGTTPEAGSVFLGIQPVVIGLIMTAVWRLARKACKTGFLVFLAAAVAVASVLGAGPIFLLFVGGVAGLAGSRLLKGIKETASVAYLFLLPTLAATGSDTPPSLYTLGFFFLKVGAVLFGSGYVLIAFIEQGLVHDLGWLSREQLLDAIALGQLSPGPVLSTATIVGFIVAGWSGAAVATVSIFFPSFVFVALLAPVTSKLRNNPWIGRILDAVSVSALGLMAAVVVRLSYSLFPDQWPLILAAAVSCWVQIRLKVSSVWLIGAGALLGLVLL